MFDAIQLLHKEAKLLHRNIKPEVFRIAYGQIKLINFKTAIEYENSDGVHIK
jgi:hypothetical protein